MYSSFLTLILTATKVQIYYPEKILWCTQLWTLFCLIIHLDVVTSIGGITAHMCYIS